MTSQKENGESGTKSHQVAWQSLTRGKPRRSNNHKNDGVGTSREQANERPHAKSQDSCFGAGGDRAKGTRQMK